MSVQEQFSLSWNISNQISREHDLGDVKPTSAAAEAGRMSLGSLVLIPYVMYKISVWKYQPCGLIAFPSTFSSFNIVLVSGVVLRL